MINSTAYFVAVWGLVVLWGLASAGLFVAALMKRSWRLALLALAIFFGGLMTYNSIQELLQG